MKTTFWRNFIPQNLRQIFIFLYQAAAVVIYVLLFFQAQLFFNTPFLGAFIEHTLVSNSVGPQSDPNWQLFNLGVNEFGYRLESITLLRSDGRDAETFIPRSRRELSDFLQNHAPGESVRVAFETPELTSRSYVITLSKFPSDSQAQFFYAPYLVGGIYLLLSLWIFGLRRRETAGRAFAMIAASVAIATGGLFDLYTTGRFIYLWVISVPLASSGLIHLALVFPQEARIVLKYPFLRWAPYIPGFILAGINMLFSLYRFDEPRLYAQIWLYSYLYLAFGILFFFLATIYRLFWSPSPVARQQARTILIGTLIGFAPITSWLLLTQKEYANFNPYFYFLPLVVFPATTGYAVLRYRLIKTDYLLGRGAVYGLLSLLAIAGYLFINTSLSLILGPVAPNDPYVIALAVLVISIALNPLRTRLQQAIDVIFFRGERAHQERLNVFTREIANAVGVNEVIKILREQITASLLPSQLHIFTYDGLSDQYTASQDETGRITTDVRFASKSALPIALRRESLPIFVDESHVPDNVVAEKGRIALLRAQLFIPMPGRDRLAGWIALGERLSGESYATHDITFLESIASQSAVALERAQVMRNMERRVHEMNVLARVAQGINVTLNFDDILELIYAQSAQIIPGSDFHLTLYNKATHAFSYAFCLEDDERLPKKENSPLPPKTTLEQEVIISRRPILTQDYQSQCQMMGINSSVKGVYAWLGVPLNTGAETIGALSIASRDAGVTYTTAQMELFQAIADQTAGAIVKARLLQETERRAQQLTTLNQIARQLASTLELDPLLKSILESAVSILNAEAGSLFLVDQQTDELIFQVTVGPVASNLVGHRLPAGTGFVGKAVTTRQPVIVNDVAATTTWNSATDQQTGFITRAILAVPMEVKERVIGIIEVVNKRDGSPFAAEDENLLSAFGGQAAVALENARLYTLTDRELNARVEELSVMQRIDRELNASLEVDRAMRITLEWAMRQSKSNAGLIGFVEEKGVYMVAKQGYTKELDEYDQEYMPFDHPALAEALLTSAPQRASLTQRDISAFLEGARSQLVIPIRRESIVIGLFLLESTDPEGFQQDELDFLSRLADHAAIAIANAQLYAEVQRANIAKSEFVSFVAHELKNPMTSIKGYSELLAAGAVGPINEMQTNFLSTIRSNIERMKTIVEDLNDNSKIEAGRMRLDFKAVDVPDVVDDVARSTKRQVDEKKQTLEVSLPENLPAVWADRTRILQILVNLVSNAHKYTPEGGAIVVSAERVANRWNSDGAKEVVHLAVKDNGIGITPEDQKKIFQKFFRSEDDQARKSPGTGLGLNITKSLVEMQGGNIWFESEFRKGTTFHITIPVSEN